jgi:hypothetical protein
MRSPLIPIINLKNTQNTYNYNFEPNFSLPEISSLEKKVDKKAYDDRSSICKGDRKLDKQGIGKS